MNDPQWQGVDALLQPLLGCLGALEQLARGLHPPALRTLLARAAPAAQALADACAARPDWPAALAELGNQLDLSAEQALSAFDGLREAGQAREGLLEAYRALRHLPRALEALYPLAGILPEVSRYFLDERGLADPVLQAQLIGANADDTGVLAFGDASDPRAALWMYVPETYDPRRACPLVMALHGGSGRGRAFLWSWLRAARSHGAVLVAPTSLDTTWALMGEDEDSPRLAQILDFVRSRWCIDPQRLLLTGMSDGGTFCYASGLNPASPFTHLAPTCSAFHPMLAQMADPRRLQGLPIHIVHGALDWMFPVEMAREAAASLRAAGARVSLREIDDLSHVYPAETNGSILEWMRTTERGR